MCLVIPDFRPKHCDDFVSRFHKSVHYDDDRLLKVGVRA
jgi:hypothetical protein